MDRITALGRPPLPFNEQLGVVGEVMNAARALLPLAPKVLASRGRHERDLS